MKLLLVTSANAWTRSTFTLQRYLEAGKRLGHSVAVYGTPNSDVPELPYTTDLDDVDLALFIIQIPTDFPDMPLLARLLDGIPREKRIVVDLWGRYNDTIRIDHDFNHLEKLDDHLGWEWEDAIEAVSDVIVQPTLKPLRQNVGTFLFHGFEPACVARNYASADQAAAAWRSKPYGAMYVGSNWHRWHQVRRFLEQYGTVRDTVGPMYLIGWDWWERPQWAIDQGIMGVDTDQAFLDSLKVEVRDGVRFNAINSLLDEARFVPVIHRPLFRLLGMVTGRTFEAFHADTLPVLLLPHDLVEAIYGPAALTLAPHDVAAFLSDAMKRPEKYWDAVLQTREHLARHQSYATRYAELEALIPRSAGRIDSGRGR